MFAGVTAIAWSLEEKLLVVGTQDGAMVVWDVEEQQVVHVLTGHTGDEWEAGWLHIVPRVTSPSRTYVLMLRLNQSARTAQQTICCLTHSGRKQAFYYLCGRERGRMQADVVLKG